MKKQYKPSIIKIYKIVNKIFLDGVPLKGYIHKLFLDFAPEIKKKALWEYLVTNDALIQTCKYFP